MLAARLGQCTPAAATPPRLSPGEKRKNNKEAATAPARKRKEKEQRKRKARRGAKQERKDEEQRPWQASSERKGEAKEPERAEKGAETAKARRCIIQEGRKEWKGANGGRK